MDHSRTVVGIDWGTTHRRAYVLDAAGDLKRQHQDECGILAIHGNFQASLRALLAHLDVVEADVVMSGMVGSRNGWRQTPYLSIEQPILQLPQLLVDMDCALAKIRCRMVPGYCFIDSFGTPDVMRGEETQILGALALGAPHGWFVLPGTHCKWVHVSEGHVMEIMTFMTGEFFSLLSEHGTLANLMGDEQDVSAAFQAGLRAAQHGGGFTHVAFGCRALVVTDVMPAAHVASYLSGILIGAELAAIRQKARGQGQKSVQVIGSAALAQRYVDALAFFDMPATVWPPEKIYVAALRRLTGLEK